MPPTVTKQIPGAPTQTIKSSEIKADSILDRIKPVAQVDSGGLKMNIFGRNGSGKTTFACTFPKPLIIIGFEDGTKSVKKVAGVDFVPISSTEDMEVVQSYILKDRKYKSVVLDTATALQELMLSEVLNRERLPTQLKWGEVSQKQYQRRAEKTKEGIRLFLDLATFGINVVVLAQEKDHTRRSDEGSEVVASELLTPFIASSLGDRTCHWVQERVDNICQTFTREQTETTFMEIGDQKIPTTRKTGKIEFCLRTQRAHPVYGAKIRADKNLTLEDVIVDPSYDKFIKMVTGAK